MTSCVEAQLKSAQPAEAVASTHRGEQASVSATLTRLQRPPLSSRGLGRRPLTAETRVRIPVAVLQIPAMGLRRNDWRKCPLGCLRPLPSGLEQSLSDIAARRWAAKGAGDGHPWDRRLTAYRLRTRPSRTAGVGARRDGFKPRRGVAAETDEPWLYGESSLAGQVLIVEVESA